MEEYGHMAENPLLKLHAAGQSVWLDSIDRALLSSGELERLVQSGEVQGVTSNPAIFQKAISTCAEYVPAIRARGRQSLDSLAAYDELACEDIRNAAAVLEPVFEATQGHDGYVSLEVSPRLAHDVAGTVAEAKRLFAKVARPNVMIKVPATTAGETAIAELIAAGLNVNATLIFSPENYERVAYAYITGLERLASAGAPLDGTASVASFFVSRVDTAVDKLLEARLAKETDPAVCAQLQRLLGQAAIANAKVAYERFHAIFAEERSQRLRRQGARVQRPLWASTSTKNPQYRDVRYVEELIGPDTVDTMPPATLAAFRDHGQVRLSLTEDVEHAHQVFAELARLGIDMSQVYAGLQTAGVRSFAESFEALLTTVRERQIELAR
jgi:transaldolase